MHRFPIIESENLFIDVPEQMEWLDRNVGAVQAALQQRPEVLNPVRVNIAVHVGFHVIDSFVSVVGLEPPVSGPFVRVHRGALFYVLHHVWNQGDILGILDHFDADLAVALQNALYSLLVRRSAAFALKRPLLPFGVHIAGVAANVSFVDLDLTAELPAAVVILHRKADSMEHEPSSFLGHSDGPVELP